MSARRCKPEGTARQPTARPTPAGRRCRAGAADGTAGQAGATRFPRKRFQFYDILPGKSDAVPDKVGKPEAKKEEPKKEEPKKEEKKEEPRKEEVKESKTPLFLQAGSFSTAQRCGQPEGQAGIHGRWRPSFSR